MKLHQYILNLIFLCFANSVFANSLQYSVENLSDSYPIYIKDCNNSGPIQEIAPMNRLDYPVFPYDSSVKLCVHWKYEQLENISIENQLQNIGGKILSLSQKQHTFFLDIKSVSSNANPEKAIDELVNIQLTEGHRSIPVFIDEIQSPFGVLRYLEIQNLSTPNMFVGIYQCKTAQHKSTCHLLSPSKPTIVPNLVSGGRFIFENINFDARLNHSKNHTTTIESINVVASVFPLRKIEYMRDDYRYITRSRYTVRPTYAYTKISENQKYFLSINEKGTGFLFHDGANFSWIKNVFKTWGASKALSYLPFNLNQITNAFKETPRKKQFEVSLEEISYENREERKKKTKALLKRLAFVNKSNGREQFLATGVTISGGGVRACVGGSASISGLVKSKTMDSFHYISGVSGGSWAIGLATILADKNGALRVDKLKNHLENYIIAENKKLNTSDIVLPMGLRVPSIKDLQSWGKLVLPSVVKYLNGQDIDVVTSVYAWLLAKNIFGVDNYNQTQSFYQFKNKALSGLMPIPLLEAQTGRNEYSLNIGADKTYLYLDNTRLKVSTEGLGRVFYNRKSLNNAFFPLMEMFASTGIAIALSGKDIQRHQLIEMISAYIPQIIKDNLPLDFTNDQVRKQLLSFYDYLAQKDGEQLKFFPRPQGQDELKNFDNQALFTTGVSMGNLAYQMNFPNEDSMAQKDFTNSHFMAIVDRGIMKVNFSLKHFLENDVKFVVVYDFTEDIMTAGAESLKVARTLFKNHPLFPTITDAQLASAAKGPTLLGDLDNPDKMSIYYIPALGNGTFNPLGPENVQGEGELKTFNFSYSRNTFNKFWKTMENEAEINHSKKIKEYILMKDNTLRLDNRCKKDYNYQGSLQECKKMFNIQL